MRAAARRLSAVLVALCALAAASYVSPAEADTIEQRIALLEPHLTIVRPEGDGPFTTVLLMHGCGGRKRIMDNYAAAVRDAGAAAIVIDSLEPRGIGRISAASLVCTGALLRGAERAGDLYAIMAWAHRQPWVDDHRIIAAGWSHGAWSVMDALSLRPSGEMRRATHLTNLPSEPLAGLAGVFLVYPYAGPPSFAGKRPWRLSPPTTAIVGGQDYVVGHDAPLRALERLRAHGVPIESRFYPEATHAFDEPDARDLRVRYSPGRTRETERYLAELIRRAAAAPPPAP